MRAKCDKVQFRRQIDRKTGASQPGKMGNEAYTNSKFHSAINTTNDAHNLNEKDVHKPRMQNQHESRTTNPKRFGERIEMAHTEIMVF